jgi:hypothetical protein
MWLMSDSEAVLFAALVALMVAALAVPPGWGHRPRCRNVMPENALALRLHHINNDSVWQIKGRRHVRAVEVGRALVVAFDPADRRDFPAGVVARELSLLLM